MIKITQKRHIVITGGSRGIGLAVARAFVLNGDRVLLIARDREELVRAQKLLEHNASYVAVDVSQRTSFKKIRESIRKEFKNTVDVLVNAAGIYGPKGELSEFSENDLTLLEKTIAINLMGTVFMCALVLPLMKRKKFGRIINFSGGGDGPFPYFTAYSASKGAVVRFTESLAAEVRQSGITVNAIAPGAVNTHLLEEALKAGPKKIGIEYYQRARVQKKEGGVPPERAAELIVFLSGKEAASISGKVISAVYDRWSEFPKHLREIASSDIYNVRRIKPKDRGYNW